MKEVKAYNVIVGEEVGTKVKGFLIMPTYTTVRVGDLVETQIDKISMRFRALYVDNYCPEDGTVMTVLRVALGHPLKVTSVIREDPVKWGDDSDDVDG